jgi:hypothetical protein
MLIPDQYNLGSSVHSGGGGHDRYVGSHNHREQLVAGIRSYHLGIPIALHILYPTAEWLRQEFGQDNYNALQISSEGRSVSGLIQARHL